MQKETDFREKFTLTKCLNTSESIKMRWRKRRREIEEDSRLKWEIGVWEEGGLLGARAEGLQSKGTPQAGSESWGPETGPGTGEQQTQHVGQRFSNLSENQLWGNGSKE